jgi:hypothetical protein
MASPGSQRLEGAATIRKFGGRPCQIGNCAAGRYRASFISRDNGLDSPGRSEGLADVGHKDQILPLLSPLYLPVTPEKLRHGYSDHAGGAHRIAGIRGISQQSYSGSRVREPCRRQMNQCDARTLQFLRA